MINLQDSIEEKLKEIRENIETIKSLRVLTGLCNEVTARFNTIERIVVNGYAIEFIAHPKNVHEINSIIEYLIKYYDGDLISDDDTNDNLFGVGRYHIVVKLNCNRYSILINAIYTNKSTCQYVEVGKKEIPIYELKCV